MSLMKTHLITAVMAVALGLPAGVMAQSKTPTAAPPTATASSGKATEEAGARVVCRRVEVTGSLIKRGKVCKPAAEWSRIMDRGNDTARSVVESGMACAGGPTCNPGT